MDQEYAHIERSQLKKINEEKKDDMLELEKTQKATSKRIFFEHMNDTIDKISTKRYQKEYDEQYQMTAQALESRKLSNKKLSMSQRILFTNKKNPFAGTDGFSHLLNREA